MGQHNEVLYKVENITKVFGNHYVFNDVSFKIKKGEIFGIIGSSGSGKTTLLNLLIGFVKPEKGEVKYRDLQIISPDNPKAFRSVHKNKKSFKRVYGFASQLPSFYPNLTVIENLHYFGSLYGLSKEHISSNAESLLELVGLTQSQHILARKLSGGMQRRLDIACSLVHEPKILFLDEPTSDLDPVLSNKIWNLLRIVNQRGTTIIMASHHIMDLEHLCSRVAIIKEGCIAALGKPNEIKTKNSVTESILLESQPGNYKKIINELKKLKPKSIYNHDVKNKVLTIYTSKPGEVVHDLIDVVSQLKEDVINIEFIKPTLDEVFVKLNKGDTIQEKSKVKKKKRKKRDNKKKTKKKHKKK